MIRRFLQRFQKGIRGLRHQAIRLIDDSEFHSGPGRMHPEQSLKLPNLFNENFSRFGFGLNGVKISRLGRIPVDRPKKFSHQAAFPTPLRSRKEKRMGKPPLGVCLSQITQSLFK